MLRRLAFKGWSAPVPLWGLVAVSAGLGISGCAHSPSRSIARTWQSVPSIPWSRAAATDEKSTDDSDPKVVANSSSDAPAGKSADAAPRRFWSPLTGSKSAEVAATEQPKPSSRRAESMKDPFLEEELLAQARQSVQKEPEPSLRSHRARLKAALDHDSQSVENLELAKRQEDQLKLRVGSLVNRARHELEAGDLVAARRAAELAQSLVESGELEFAPDEERPLDLIAQIDARLEPLAEPGAELAALQPDADTDAVDTAEMDQEPPAATQVSLTRKSETLPERTPAFDPFAEDSPRVRLKGDKPRAEETTLVVLETPDFGDESETAQAEEAADRVMANQPLAIAEVSSSQLHRSLKELPPPPDEQLPGMPPGELEGPSLAMDPSAAPAPPILLPESSASPDLFSLDEGEAEEIQPAGILPRWMPLSVLSLLLAAFAVWLWRRRSRSMS